MWTAFLLTVAAVAAVASPAHPAHPAAPAALPPAHTASATPAQHTEGTPDERLAQAREHWQAGRGTQAAELLTAMLEEGAGDDNAVRMLLAEVQLAGGEYQAAADTLSSAAAPDAELKLAAGRAYKAWGDAMAARGTRKDDVGFAYDEARSWLGLAADGAAPGDVRAAVELGFFELYVAHDVDAAVARAKALVKADPKNGEALLLSGCAGLMLSLGDENDGDAAAAAVLRSRAIEDLVAAAKALPKTRVEPWVQLAWLYEADDQAEKAVRAAAEIMDRVDTADLTTLYHLYSRYAGEARWIAAGEALYAMAKRRPRELTDRLRAEPDVTAAARAMSWAAGGLVGAGKMEEARDALAPAMAVDPQDGDIWNNYGFICRETRDYDTAYTAYEKALTFQPDEPRLLNDTGLLLHYYLHRDYDRAAELYEHAVEMADAQLKSTDLSEERRGELETARKDAVGNLTKLAAGDYDWP